MHPSIQTIMGPPAAGTALSEAYVLHENDNLSTIYRPLIHGLFAPRPSSGNTWAMDNSPPGRDPKILVASLLLCATVYPSTDSSFHVRDF